MYKLPTGYKKLTGAWKRRYFVLMVDGLHYYTKEQPQFKDDFSGDLAVNSPEYLGCFRIHPYTQITQNLSPLSEDSGCPKSITIANENNEVIILHPDATEPTSDKCEVLQRWVDALGASVEYSREMSRQRDLQSRKSSVPMPNSAQFSLVIGCKQPKHDITAASTQMSAGYRHEYFGMALMETIGQLVSNIVETLDLKWLHQPAIFFRGKPTAGGACKLGFLGDTEDLALHPDRTMEQFMQWAGKANVYECFIAPEALDWEQMMPWEHTGAHSRRLLVRHVPIELDPEDASLSSKRKKKNKSISSLSTSSVVVTKTHVALVVMLRQKTRNSWQLRLEILKVVGLDPNRVPKSEVCEVECLQRNIDTTGELSEKRVPEINRRKSTKAAKNMQVPEFTMANRPAKFDFVIASPNITVLKITLKSGGRKLSTVTLEPLDIISFASPIFLNQIEKHVELKRKLVPYTMPLHTQLIADQETKSTSMLPDSFGEAIRATNQVTRASRTPVRL